MIGKSLFAAPAFVFALMSGAAAQDESARVICKVTIDRAAELVRLGETEHARRMQPQVQKCQQLLRADLDREARKIAIPK
jgi:hypothetical protein